MPDLYPGPCLGGGATDQTRLAPGILDLAYGV